MGTGIEWTDETWNPTTGCDQVSPGCDNCYALTMAGRLKAMGQDAYQVDGDLRTSGPGFGLQMHPDRPTAVPTGEVVAARVTADATHVTWDNKWRYFCGCMWRRLSQRQQIAQDLLTVEEEEK